MVESVQYLTHKAQYKSLDSSILNEIEHSQASLYLLKHFKNNDILKFTQTVVDQKIKIQLKKMILKLDDSVVDKYLQEIQLKVKSPIFYYLNKEKKLKYQELVINYLQDNLLVDKSNAKMIDWFIEIIDEDFYKKHIHNNLLKLINRSDKNIIILNEILKLDIDFSNYFQDFFQIFQEQLDNDQAVEIFQKILSQSKNKTKDSLSKIQELISKTYNEKQKVRLISFLQSYKEMDISDYILNQSISIQNEESVQIFRNMLKDIKINDNSIQIIKKNLTSQNSKCLSIILSALEFSKNQDLNDLINQHIIQNYFKNTQKIVTNYNCFLIALKIVEFDDPKILKNDLFINKHLFFQKATKSEISHYLQIMLNIELLNDQHAIQIYQAIKNKVINSDDLQKILKIKDINHIIQVLYIQQFFQEIDDFKHQTLLNFVIKNCNHVEEDYYYQLLYVIYGFKVSKKQQKIFIKTLKDKQKILQHIQDNLDDYLFSVMNENCYQGFSKAFSDLQCIFLIEKIKPMFIYENFLIGQDNIKEIDEQYQLNTFFVDSISKINQYMIENQFSTVALKFVNIQQKQQPQQQPQQQSKKQSKGPAKQTNKKDKIEFFDEEQLLKFQQQQSLDLALNYFKRTNGLLKSLIENSQIKLKFFECLYLELINLTKINQANAGIFDILSNLFQSYKETQGYSYALTEIILKMNEEEPCSEENIDNLLKFLAKLQKIDETSFVFFYKHLCCYILQNKSFESKIKKQVVHALFNLLQKDKENNKMEIIQTYKIFVQNVNTLSNFEYSEKLFMFLVKQIEKDQINLIFSDLLNLNQKSQDIFMKSLLLDEVKEFPNSFEIYVTLRIIIYQKNDLAEQVFKKINFQPETIQQQSVQNFDLYKFLTNNIKENLDLFILIIKQQFQQPYILEILIDKTLHAIQQLFKYDQPEETMLFLPNFFSSIQIDNNYYKKIIDTIVNICCSQDHPNLFQKSLQFCLELIKSNGNQHNKLYLSIYDPYLEQKLSVQQQIFILVCMGVLAPFIQNKEKVQQLGDKILNLLKIPDENIQKSISQCIPDLFIFFDNPKQLIKENLESIKKEKNMDIQRGMAYLISGLIKGLGVKTVEDLQINEMIQNIDKNDNTIKLAILWIFNALLQNLNKIFEPYFLKFFDQFIQFFSESNEAVRNLAIQTARLGMSNISAYGVSKLLPILLSSLDDGPNWRSKIANLWALGNMAYCSPKTLSSCLPQIVPVLSKSLTDTHPKIRQAAHEALTLIGSTIRNPELTLIVDVLIKSISDPFYENKKGLNILLKTEFVHFIDVPALSLIVPIVEYALTSREQESKELAAKIVATITYLIKDPKDLMPYLKSLIKSLKETVCDHLTEVRTIASKAFGSLAKKLSLQYSDQLKDLLFGILNSDTSTSVDRAGAAQALCQVIHNIGHQQFDHYFPFILKNTQSQNKNIKEGYIGMFIYFPQIMEDQFEQFISVSIDHILITISDQNENLRNLALRVVKIFIQKYGKSQIDLLLLPILDGVFSTNYLRRASCGILLEDILKSVNLKKAEIYNQTIIYLFILKFDFVDTIKMHATNTWKANIDNTPKTLKQLLPELIKSLCDLTSKNEADIKYIVFDCIKEFMEKYQDSCLFNIIDILGKYLKENVENRVGAFEVIQQILINTDKNNIKKYEVNLIDLMKVYMTEKSDHLRKVVFQVFTGLIQKTKNTNCLNILVEPLFIEEELKDYDQGVKILTELLASNSQIIIDYITPKLFSSPLSSFKIDTIMNNAEQLGPYLYQNQVQWIFPELFEPDFKMKDQLLYCINQLSIHIKEEDVQNFFIEILEFLEKDQQNEIIDILLYFLQNTSLDFLEYFLDIFEKIVPMITIRDENVAQKVNQILEIILNMTDDNEQYLGVLIQSMDEIQSDFYALNIENGLQPYLQIIKKSLVKGDDDECVNAIDLLNILINNCDEENFVQYSGKFLGYLIRVLNYKKDHFLKQKIFTLIQYFYELPNCQIYEWQILNSYFNLLGQKSTQIQKQLVSNILDIIENIENKQIAFRQFFQNLKKYQNDQYIYCLYEMVKQKIQWFDKVYQEQIIEICSNLLKNEQLFYKNKTIIGKVLGYLMKNNSQVIKEIQQLEDNIQGDEINIQNATYTYLLVVAGVIRKSQDLGTLKNEDIIILEYIDRITNVQRQMKIVLALRKILNRPELSFLGVSEETLKTVCGKEDEEQE